MPASTTSTFASTRRRSARAPESWPVDVHRAERRRPPPARSALSDDSVLTISVSASGPSITCVEAIAGSCDCSTTSRIVPREMFPAADRVSRAADRTRSSISAARLPCVQDVHVVARPAAPSRQSPPSAFPTRSIIVIAAPGGNGSDSTARARDRQLGLDEEEAKLGAGLRPVDRDDRRRRRGPAGLQLELARHPARPSPRAESIRRR